MFNLSSQLSGNDESHSLWFYFPFKSLSPAPSLSISLRHVLHGFISIQLVFGSAPAAEISRTVNSVAASTRFSILIITGSVYVLGPVQVSCQTFRAPAFSGNSRPGHSGNEIGRLGVPIDHSPTGSWECGDAVDGAWELQRVQKTDVSSLRLTARRGWVGL